MNDEIFQRMERMQNEAIYELLHYYDKDVKQKLRNMLKKAAGRYVPPYDGIFWDTGLLANGLMELWTHRMAGAGYAEAEENSGILKAVSQYFDQWMERGMPIYCLDDTLCGAALLHLYEVTSDEKYKAGADKLAYYLLALGEKETDAAGSIPYRPAQKNGDVYADGIGMMCPFLSMYGVKYGNEEAVRLALTQIENMLEYGMDERTGLPYHGFRYENRIKYGIIGWGRAVGWLLMGMRGILYWLREEDTASKRELETAFWRLLETVRAYQRADGGFSWQLEAMEGPADSSATAMIAQAVKFGLSIIQSRKEGNKVERKALSTIDFESAKADIGYKSRNDWEEVLQAAIKFLLQNEKDGKVYQCLGECMGFSQYPQVYGAYPWSLGTALEVIDALLPAAGRRLK